MKILKKCLKIGFDSELEILISHEPEEPGSSHFCRDGKGKEITYLFHVFHFPTVHFILLQISVRIGQKWEQPVFQAHGRWKFPPQNHTRFYGIK